MKFDLKGTTFILIPCQAVFNGMNNVDTNTMLGSVQMSRPSQISVDTMSGHSQKNLTYNASFRTVWTALDRIALQKSRVQVL